MKFIEVTPVADVEGLIAALRQAQPGAAFELQGGSARYVLTLSAVRSDEATGPCRYTPNPAEPARYRPHVYDSELFPIITHRLITGQARSSLAATKQIVAEGLYPANGGTPENRAHRLSKLYRAVYIPKSAFQKSKIANANPITSEA